MNQQYIIDNWNELYKSYSKLNPDLHLNGIISKRALLNHYIKYGCKENRQIIDIDDNKNIIIEEKKIQKQFILTEDMIIENI